MTASYCNLKFAVPKLTSSVHNDTGTSSANSKAEYKENAKTVEWSIKKFPGETEHILTTKILLQTNANTYTARKEIGPINVVFEIPMYNVSNL